MCIAVMIQSVSMELQIQICRLAFSRMGAGTQVEHRRFYRQALPEFIINYKSFRPGAVQMKKLGLLDLKFLSDRYC